MIFSSYSFVLFFLPVVLAGTALLQRAGRHAVLLWLIAASLFFYGWWDWHYLWVPLASVAANYAIGHAIVARRNAGDGPGAFWTTGAGIAANLGFLAFFKYGHFVTANANWALGTGLGWWSTSSCRSASPSSPSSRSPIWSILKRGERERLQLPRLPLFVTFFPQLIAGPIVHHREMMPQFARRPRPAAPTADMVAGRRHLRHRVWSRRW